MNIVYKIYCLDSEIKDFYIGSSKKFKSRKLNHKSVCNNPNNNRHNFKLYKFIKANGGFQNFDFEILLETEFDDIKSFEQEYIKELKPTLNCIKAFGFDSKDYYKNNKQKIKNYYENNKEKILKKKRLYYEKNKENRKEYRLKNKEKIKEYYKLYYLKKKLIHNDLKK